MNDTAPDVPVEPAFNLDRFSCPHCRQLASQIWLNAYAQPVNNPAGVPLRIAGVDLERLSRNTQFPPELREKKLAYWNRVNSGMVFLDRWAPVQTDLFVAGLELSVCRNCMESAIWIGARMVWPSG